MEIKALFKLTHGLYILGSRDNERYVGSVVDAVMQVANKPQVIALSCNCNSYTRECIAKCGEFSISVLSKKVNPMVIANFGFKTSRSCNKWETVEMVEKDGLPYLKDNIATIRAKVLQTIVFESNTLFLAEVLDAEDTNCESPLTYNDYRDYFKDEVFKCIKHKGEQK